MKKREREKKRDSYWDIDTERGLELIIGKIETSGALAGKVYCGMESHFTVSIRGKRKKWCLPARTHTQTQTHTHFIYIEPSGP